MKPALNHLTLLLFVGLSACAGPQRQLDRALANGDWQSGESLLQEHDSLIIDAESRLALYRATEQREAWLTTLDATRDAARTAGGEVAARPWYAPDLLSYEQECAFVLRQTDRWLSTLVNQRGEVTLAEGEFAFGLQALQTVAGRVPETLLVLTRVLFANADLEETRLPGTWQQLEAASIDAVFRTLYLRRYTTVESMLALIQEHAPTQVSWQQAYAAWALESRARREGDAALQAADSVTLLQWATRWEQAGLSRAAGAAWRVLAEQRTGNDAAIAWRSAGDALYAAGETDAARVALERSVESATDTLLYAQSTARTAHARGDTDWGLEHLATALDARSCAIDDTEAQAVLDAEWQWAAMRLAQQQSGNRATTPSPERVRQVQHRSAMLARVHIRMAQCNSETLVLQVAQALHGIGQENEAHELLMAQFDAYGGSYSLFGVWFEQPLTDTEAADIASRLDIWLATLPDEIPDDSLRFLVGVLTNRRETAIVEVRNRWLQAELTSPRVQLPLALVQARYLQEADLFDERRRLLEEVIEAQENPIQARAQVARWMVSWAEPDEAAEFAANLAQRPEATAILEDISEAEAISIRQYAWRLALTASVESGDVSQVLRAAFAWAEERGADNPDTWRYLWTLRTVWEVLGPEQRIEFAQRSEANGYCPPEMREDWGFALAELGNHDGAIAVLLPLVHESQSRVDAMVVRVLREWERDDQQRFSAAWRQQHGNTVQWQRARILALASAVADTEGPLYSLSNAQIFAMVDLTQAVLELQETDESSLPEAGLFEQGRWEYTSVLENVRGSESAERNLVQRIWSHESWDTLGPDVQRVLATENQEAVLELLRTLDFSNVAAGNFQLLRVPLYRFRNEDAGLSVLRQIARSLTIAGRTIQLDAFVEQEILTPVRLMSQGVREFGPDWGWRGDPADGIESFLELASNYAERSRNWALLLECIQLRFERTDTGRASLLREALNAQMQHRGGTPTVDDVSYWIAQAGGGDDIWRSGILHLERLGLHPLLHEVIAIAPTMVRLDPDIVTIQLGAESRFLQTNPDALFEALLDSQPAWTDQEIVAYVTQLVTFPRTVEAVERLPLFLEVCRRRGVASERLAQLEGSWLAESGQMRAAANAFSPRGSNSVLGDAPVLYDLGLTQLSLRAMDQQARVASVPAHYALGFRLRHEVHMRFGSDAWLGVLQEHLTHGRHRTAEFRNSNFSYQFQLSLAIGDIENALTTFLEYPPDDTSRWRYAGQLTAFLTPGVGTRRWFVTEQPPIDSPNADRALLQIVHLGGILDEFRDRRPESLSTRDAVMSAWVAVGGGDPGRALRLVSESLIPATFSQATGWYSAPNALLYDNIVRLLRSIAAQGYANECISLLEQLREDGTWNAQLQFELTRLTLQHPSPATDTLLLEWLNLARATSLVWQPLFDAVSSTGRTDLMPQLVLELERAEADTPMLASEDVALALSTEQWWVGEHEMLTDYRHSLELRGVNEHTLHSIFAHHSAQAYRQWMFPPLPTANVYLYTPEPDLTDTERLTVMIPEIIRTSSQDQFDEFLRDVNASEPGSGLSRGHLLDIFDPEIDPDWSAFALETTSQCTGDRAGVLLQLLPIAAQSDTLRFDAILSELWQSAPAMGPTRLRILRTLTALPEARGWEQISEWVSGEQNSEGAAWELARLAWRSGDATGAVHWAQQATREEQDHFAILGEHGPMLLDLRQFDMLSALADSAAAAWPGNMLSGAWHGLIFATTGTPDAAEPLLAQAALELDVSDPRTIDILEELLRLGAFEHAETLTARMAYHVDVANDGLVPRGLALALSTWTEFAPERGLAWYDEHWAPRLGNGELYNIDNELCELFIAAGQPERAELLRVLAYQLNPDDPHYLNNLAWHWAERGERLEEAEALARRAVVLENAENPNAIDTLAWIRFQQGATEDAWLMQRQALRVLARASVFQPSERLAIRQVLLDHYRAMQAALTPADQSGPEPRRSRRERRRASN